MNDMKIEDSKCDECDEPGPVNIDGLCYECWARTIRDRPPTVRGQVTARIYRGRPR